jgi:hypothetical protein
VGDKAIPHLTDEPELRTFVSDDQPIKRIASGIAADHKFLGALILYFT